ncbi:hypothetical protein EAG_04533 [Camponotus floridanus]|uniref:Tudor domain-containing protein n=1 Tax=Camponotus floridanus TaxID=104421 RepID=E2AQR7_CAMFO|nr:hypothetical protein EAG_04533 [Camponotus floridanus]
MVKISLGDWGRSIWRRMCDVYLLEDRFKELSWQTITCGLVYTGPVQNVQTWPKETKDLCRLLLEGRKGWIHIVRPLSEGKALVKLNVEGIPPTTSYFLRDAHILLGHAQFSTSVAVNVIPTV